MGGWFVWPGGTGQYDVRGGPGPEFVGGKYWNTDTSEWVELDTVAIHFMGGWATPPDDYLEICAIHAAAPSTENLRYMDDTDVQCWVGLGTDGQFRLFSGWTPGVPASGTLLATCPTPVTLATGTPASNPLYDEEDGGGFLSRWIFYFEIGNPGRLIVWHEDETTGCMLKFWEVEADLQPHTAFASQAWSVGQRADFDPLTESVLNGPFPGDPLYYWRFQDLVVSDQPIGRIWFHTLFPEAVGSANDFPMVDPEGGLGSTSEGLTSIATFTATTTVVAGGGWTNPANTIAQDGSYATAAPGTSTTITTAFGFPAITTGDIPDGSHLRSVKVRYRYKTSVGTSVGSALRYQLDKNGSTFGTNFTDSVLSTTDVTHTGNDLSSNLTLADLRTANFTRIRIGAQRTTGAAITWSLDSVELVVEYIPANTARALAVRDDPLLDFSPSPDEANTMVAQDGSDNAETERYTFQGIPALALKETVIAVGLSFYAAGQGGELISDIYEGNQAAYGFRAQAHTQLLSGSDFIEGSPRSLFDADEDITLPNAYVPNPDPTGQGMEGMGWFGYVHWVDWWTDRLGQYWSRDQVNALEGGIQTIFRAVFLSQVTLLVITAEPLGEGPPINPWPTEPPEPPPEEEGRGEWPMQRGLWRDPIVPSSAMRVGEFRITGASLEDMRKWVMWNGVWREITAAELHDEDPPSDLDPPPFFDPCELHPDLPLPPTEPLGPPPERLFFAFDLPITTIPQIFTAAVNATGPWTPGNLAQAVARGGSIVGGIGGYSKYQSGGQYQRSLMTAWIDSHAPYMDAVVAEPFFYGQICMDDHAARDRWHWPPSFSDQDITDEISYIAGYWKASYPGIRMGIRAREAQFSGSNYPSNIDFMMAQYRYWGLGGLTPSGFVSQELGLAGGRGHDILFSINFENGGLGPSSPYGGSSYTHRTAFEVGPGELDTAWDAMTVDVSNMHGIGGWKYSAEFLGHPGILDVIAVRRNALQAIGAP